VGNADVQILSPSSKNGYADIGDIATPFMRAAWRALVCGDLLHKQLLQTRPHEDVTGTADQVFRECVLDLCRTIEASCAEPDCQLRDLVDAMQRSRDRFRNVPAHYDPEMPLIGVVGEIFCRLNTFSNEDLVRKLEGYGAEAWLSDIAEWIGYSNQEVRRKLRLQGQGWSLEMLKAKLREHVQHGDEHALRNPFREDSIGYEEPEIDEILELGAPYLPHYGVEGEMVLSIGKAIYLAQHGADGIIDISPFTCMNGIVSEAIYPKLSKDYGGIPIRNFYFDGTRSDLDRDLGIYMELARSYQSKKNYARRYPAYFSLPLAASRMCKA
jgi:predicted nucleotide-binding protein (sugar kinase/HSP70/actin superfamily)